MENNTQQEGAAEYDKEWELDTDNPSPSSKDLSGNQQSSDSDDQFENEAPQGNEPPPSPNEPTAEVQEDVDVWADASEAQREAFRRAENEKVSADNRAKLNADKLAERGRELKALRDETHELREANRPRTEFETEHEVYAQDVDRMIQQRLDERIPVQPEMEQAEVEQQVFDAITQAHPHAGDMYNSESMKTLLNEDPVMKINGKAMLFSETLHSNDPADVIAALDFYKTTHDDTAPSSAPSGLEAMQSGTPRGNRTDMRTAGQLSSQERYDQEWELDDDF
jgi:hypothetical protein